MKKLSFALLLSLFLGLFNLSAQTPQLNITSDTGLISDTAELDFSFSNTGGDVCFQPTIEILLPDGVDVGTLAWDSPGGATVDCTVTSGPATATNPETGDEYPVLTGESYIFCQTPTGTLSPAQPPLQLAVGVSFNSDAAPGIAEEIQGQASCVLGNAADGTPSSCADSGDTICGGFENLNITGELARIEKLETSPEGLKATGPTHNRTYTINVDVATANDITDGVITDTIPDTLFLTGTYPSPVATDSALVYNCSTASGVPTGSTCSVTANPGGGGTLSITLPTPYTGVAGNDIAFAYTAYVQRLRGGTGAQIVNSNSGDVTTSQNLASLNYNEAAAPLTSIVTISQRSIDLKKTHTLAGIAQPDSVISWRVTSQISDYFNFENITYTDITGDGQTINPGTFSVSITKPGVSKTISQPAMSNLVVGTQDLTTGRTTWNYNLSASIANGDFAPEITSTGQLDGAARVRINYNTTISRVFESDAIMAPNTNIVDSGDFVINNVSLASNVVGGLSESRSASDRQNIVQLTTVTKSFALKNGVTPANTSIQPGDVITYEVGLTIPTGDAERILLTDYLPQPLFSAADPDFDGSPNAFFAEPSGCNDPSNGGTPAPGGYCYIVGSETPPIAVSVNAGSNAIFFNLGTVEDDNAPSAKTFTIRFSVVAGNKPTADGLKLVNLLFAEQGNSAGAGAVASASTITPLVVNNPKIRLEKSVVSTGLFEAGDSIVYGLNVINTGGFKAFQVLVEDIVPATLKRPSGGYNITYGPDCDLSAGPTDNSTAAKLSVGNLIVAAGTTCRLTFAFEADNSIVFGSKVQNQATARFKSSPAATAPFFATAVSTLAEVEFKKPTITKTFPNNLNSNNTNSVHPNLLPGETDDFSLQVCFPKGTASNLNVIDVDSSNRLNNFVAANLTEPGAVTTNCASNTAQSFYAGKPNICFSSRAVTGGGNLTISYPTLVNYGATNNCLDFSVLATVSANSGQANNLINQGRVTATNVAAINSNANYNIVGVNLTTTKAVSTPSAPLPLFKIGDTLRYSVVVNNTNPTTGFNTVAQDTLPAGLGNPVLISATYLKGTVSTNVTANSSITPSGSSLRFAFLNPSGEPDLEPASRITFIYEVRLLGTRVADTTTGPGHPGGIANPAGCVSTRVNSFGLFEFYTDNEGQPSRTRLTSSTRRTATISLDSDGDGVPNSFEGCGDSDNDGVPDYLDTDSDDNGIPDSTECVNTATGSNPFTCPNNFRNVDDDGDGITDFNEGSVGATDTDGDGKPDYQDIDSDNDGVIDRVEGRVDSDGDGIFDYRDRDSDNDGIPDTIESGGIDVNGDGVYDCTGTFPANQGTNGLCNDIPSQVNGIADKNSDSDTRPNRIDLDSDDDGIADVIEAGDADVDNDGYTDNYDRTNGVFLGAGDPDGDGFTNLRDTSEGGTILPLPNTDGAGESDYLDPDSDGDGISDYIEGQCINPTATGFNGPATYPQTADGDGIADAFDADQGSALTTPCDTDGDSVPDYLDLDSDNDGIPDLLEDSDNVTDTDGDGIPNYRDLDSDNDGIADVIEALGADVNNDGILDCAGTFPAGYTGNGLCADLTDQVNGLGEPNADSDSVPNYLDLDSDNDGMPDIFEAGGVDANGDGLVDNITGATLNDDSNANGWSGQYDSADGGTAIVLINTDAGSNSIPDFLDTDSDNDGIVDLLECNPANYQDTAYYTVGDSAGDADSDGISNIFEAGFCLPNDLDNDSVPDFRDLDSDGDGILDSAEAINADGTDAANDSDSDGVPNFRDLDSDGDGLLDVDEAGGDDLDADDDGRIDYPADTDGDGIPDACEAGGTDVAPADGIDDSCQGGVDTDGDGVNDANDNDDDNDGVTDVIDPDSGGTPLPVPNSDGAPDGADFLDTDSDMDGISDMMEGKGDADGDGIPNFQDSDSDNDGIPDSLEGSTDTDGDGVADYLDLDADNDGIPDVTEALGTDANNDGMLDCAGTFPANQGANGLCNDLNQTFGLGEPNFDNDSRPNYKDLDSDNDGMPDIQEAGGTDTNNDGLVDDISGGLLDDDGNGNGWSGTYDPNDDGAGVGGTVIAIINTDGTDGPDFLDFDSDGDVIADVFECTSANYLDAGFVDAANTPPVDADSNGILDVFESGSPGSFCSPTDTDNDGTPDYQDLDSDGDGIPDATEVVAAIDPFGVYAGSDSDADGLPNYRDLDSDGDGLFDVDEADENGRGDDLDADDDGRVDVPADADGNGIPDSCETGGIDLAPADGIDDACQTGIDTDGDGVNDISDTDDDGDGIPDIIDADSGNTPLTVPNTDSGTGDPTPDFLDTDSDMDGIPDSVEGKGDTDGDGIPNFQDPDSDGDGISDVLEGSIDTDGDTIPDYLDLDSDNDGTPDRDEAGSTIDTLLDTDGDGIADFRDPDSDNDGIPDTIEGGNVDLDGDGEVDCSASTSNDGVGLNGWCDDQDDTAEVPANPDYPFKDADGDGLSNAQDIDSDNDGIIDNIEAQCGPDDSVSTYVIPLGADSNSDGIDDAYDAVGSGSLLTVPCNTDGTDSPDYLDNDSDNDGVPDLIEGNDADINGIIDFVCDVAADADNDGLLDCFDNHDNSSDGLSVADIVGSDSPIQNSDSDDRRDFRDTDDDNDGIPTRVEDINNNGDFTDDDFDMDGTPNYLQPNPADDRDMDGLKDDEETMIGTDPCDNDTDNDGLNDGEEVTAGVDGFLTDPLDADSDDDGIFDGQEGKKAAGANTPTALYSTSPELFDTDMDNISDGIELGFTQPIPGGISECTGVPYTGSNPAVFLADQCPDEQNTNPVSNDTDGDSFPDGDEDSNRNGCFEPSLGETNPTQGLEACDVEDLRPEQFAIDGAAGILVGNVSKATRTGKRAARVLGCQGLSNRQIDRLNNSAQKLYDELWTLTWVDVPNESYTCDPVPTGLCELATVKLTKKQIIKRAKKIERKVLRGLGGCGLEYGRGRFLVKRSKGLRRTIIKNTKSLKDEILVCSAG